MKNPFRIQQLRQFVIAAETGSLRTAATETFRSAAAVSTAMSELEQQIGAPLFEKGHRAKLTPLGRTLAPLWADLLRTHDRVARDVRQITLAERGLLTVAVVRSSPRSGSQVCSRGSWKPMATSLYALSISARVRRDCLSAMDLPTSLSFQPRRGPEVRFPPPLRRHIRNHMPQRRSAGPATRQHRERQVCAGAWL